MKIREVRGGGGLQLHVREWGDENGAPILLIHGWSQNHLSWAKQYGSSLADEFRLIAYYTASVVIRSNQRAVEVRSAERTAAFR